MTDHEAEARFVEVYRPRNSHQAGLARESIKAEGITVYINNEEYYNTGAIVASASATMRLMVPRADAKRARTIIDGLGLK